MCVSEFFYYTQEYKWHDLSAYLGEIIRFSMYIE